MSTAVLITLVIAVLISLAWLLFVTIIAVAYINVVLTEEEACAYCGTSSQHDKDDKQWMCCHCNEVN